MSRNWVEKRTIDGLPYYFNGKTEEITWDKPEALMTAEEREEESGNWVWVPHPEQLWQPVRMISKGSKGETVTQARNGRQINIPADGQLPACDLTNGRPMTVPLWGVKLSQLNRPVEDLVQMASVNEASIINNIRIRYEKDELYTWVGAARSVLISVNPYKRLPLYSTDQVDLYRNKPPNTHLKPHVFDIANDSYNSLLFENKNQSVLISGESGAGKTVCTKQCLDFLAQVAGSEQSLIEEKIVKANPLLEAFGNAQTIRNNNSSRFGKWIEVFFDPMQRKIVSAKITNYLLEKSRLVYQQKGERNYHIFYQMTTNATMKKNYGLQVPQNYHYTNQTGLYKANLIDDAKEFVEVNEAMELLNFSPVEKDFVLSVTSGILTLGNCDFTLKKEKGGVDGSELVDHTPARTAANLLGFEEDDLIKVLSYRSISVRGNVSVIPLDPEKARSARDSFAMGVYSRLFDFLVSKINIALDGKKGKFIGILDIFGFEIFQNNSFEQLCINFANEKLQAQFNQTTFKEEEALYREEGISFKHIDFIDNQIVVDLIEKAPKGILPLLDDECKIPEGNDVKFMNKMEDAHSGNARFQTDTQRKLKDSFNFEIIHYAGVVNYNGENFLMKNTDNLFQDMYDLCQHNKHTIFQEMFPKVDRRAMKSLSYQFRTQLNELMGVLYKTESRYIRCVKPNGLQKPDAFDSFLVVDQLRYSGVFEAVEIRKQGYPFRYKFAQFSCRYSCINRKFKYKTKKDNYRGRCEEILKVSKQDFSGVVFGNSMVLFKTGEFSTLELLRNLALETLIPKMQAVMRGHLAREMRRRCEKLTKAFIAAIRAGNDLPATTKAIQAVDPTLDHFPFIFPGYKPRKLKEVIKLEKDLKRWVVVEKDLEELLKKDANVVYYKLAAALQEAESLRAEKIKETQKQSQLYKQAVEARKNCILGKIDIESEGALDVMDIQRMDAVAKNAAQYKHRTNIIDEINRILSLPEIQIVKLELDKAMAMNDNRRKIHRQIRLDELNLANEESRFAPFSAYGQLRDPMAYATTTFLNKMMGSKKRAEEMKVWTRALTPTSLLTITSPDPATQKMLMRVVKDMSKQIRQYMGDKPLKPNESPESVAALMASSALQYKANGLADEAYFQVMKQIVGNPNPESVEKGYDLIAVLLATVIPSEKVEKTVLVFLKQKGKNVRKFTFFLHETRYGKGETRPSASMVQNVVAELKQGDGASPWSRADGEPTGPSK